LCSWLPDVVLAAQFIALFGRPFDAHTARSADRE